MKKLLKTLLISILIIAPLTCVQAKEDITEELREEKQENEVVLDLAKTEQNSIIEEKVNNKSNSNKFFNFLTNNDEDDNETGEKDNAELDFEIFKIFDSENTVNEDSLFGKVYHSKITRTDIPSFLYQDDLTFNYKKGPISKIHIYGAYRGSINALWRPEYSTEYNNLVTQIGAYGSFRNHNYKFKIAANPIPQRGINYIDRLLTDIYVVNTSIPNHQILAGYSRVQTGVEGGTSTYILPFVARSQIARNFGSARSLALKVIGNYQYLDYNISAGSSGRYITSGMPGAEFNSWINFKPLGHKAKKYGKITIGGGYNGGHNRIDYNVASAYLSYHHKQIWTNIEAAIADGYNGSNGISSNKACGYAATLGWKFNPHLQLIGRIDQFDPNRHISNDLKREYTIGINWFIKGQALKVMLNYVFCDNQNQPDGHKIIVATQVLL